MTNRAIIPDFQNSFLISPGAVPQRSAAVDPSLSSVEPYSIQNVDLRGFSAGGIPPGYEFGIPGGIGSLPVPSPTFPAINFVARNPEGMVAPASDVSAVRSASRYGYSFDPSQFAARPSPFRREGGISPFFRGIASLGA